MNARRHALGRDTRLHGPSPTASLVQRVVSGGQTGVDRAALDAALRAGIAIGGWCPRGRRAEDGRIPDRYPLTPTDSRSYAVRTEWNVRDSDATLILVLNEISSGTRLTMEAAKQLPRPFRIVHLLPPPAMGLIREATTVDEQVDEIVQWIREAEFRVINIAGPRGSSSPQTYPLALQFVSAVLQQLKPPGTL